MWAALMRTALGGKFVAFMRSDRGKSIDRLLVRRTGHSLLMYAFAARVGFPPIPVLMLHTIGRKSGEPRSTVMPYMELDDRIYLIGSNGAKPRDPFWVDNLRANPRAIIVVNREHRAVQARMVDSSSEEQTRVWAYARTKTPQYETYSQQTTRPLPIVALE